MPGCYRAAMAATARLGRARAEQPTAEDIRRAFANAWGEMGAAWGVQPSVARVHGYLLAHGGVLTEREVREALDLSHRAASLALAECESWGLLERVPDPRKGGRRGPSAVAYAVVDDRWRWFQRIAEQRLEREADPLVPRIETCLGYADAALATSPDDPELIRLHEWLTDLLGFVRLFDRAVRIVARADSQEIARGFGVLAVSPTNPSTGCCASSARFRRKTLPRPSTQSRESHRAWRGRSSRRQTASRGWVARSAAAPASTTAA